MKQSGEKLHRNCKYNPIQQVLNNQKVVNRLKTIKSRKMIECGNPELWKKYIAVDFVTFFSIREWAHPNAKGFHGKQIEIYHELKIVSGNYQVPSQDMSETDGTESYTASPEFGHMPDGCQEPPMIQPVRQLPKQPRASDALQDALMTAVMEIDGLEEGKKMYAFEYLNADPFKAKAFLTYNARMRKTYLFRQF
ncbi:hypothetical protein V8G54_026685 [Vigna mungo]|uniref:Uncharacterized protein n=1 Tax=Vigna mungo TaxID=3915 RepID=A0AAQ3RQP7_VIGMU